MLYTVSSQLDCKGFDSLIISLLNGGKLCGVINRERVYFPLTFKYGFSHYR